MSGSNSSAPASPAARTPHDAAEALSLTVHTLPDRPTADPSRTRRGRINMLLVLLACAAPVLVSYFTYYVIRPGARTNYSALIEPGRPLPAAAQLPLRDLGGQAVDPPSLRGQWLLIAVGDGACDATCEKLLYAQRQLREVMGREKDRIDRLWLVTGDQTPRAELLPALAQATVLQTDAAAVAQWLAPEAGQRLQDHLYLVDPIGMWMLRVPVDFDPAKVKKDFDRLMRASASWDRPGREGLAR